jgi:predicted DNA-binding transcriptional regulator YafY
MPIAQQVDLKAWQDHLDFLLPRREYLRADEVASAIGVDERTVIRLFDDQRLMGHEINAASGERQHRRFRRSGVIIYLAKTANYEPSDFRARLYEVVDLMPAAEKALLYQRIGTQLRNA